MLIASFKRASGWKMKFVDLFCGAGGFSLGMEQAGHHYVGALDYDLDSVQTFRKNFPNTAKKKTVVCADVAKMDFTKLIPKTKIKLIIGGPPCQGFSTAGRNDPKDKRNLLYRQFLRHVRTLQPEWVVMENTSALINRKNQHFFFDISNIFSCMGYFTRSFLLNSAFFSVPQIRQRLFMVARKKPLVDFFICDEFEMRNAKDTLEPLSGVKLPNHELPPPLPNDDIERLAHIQPGESIRYQKDNDRLPERLRLKIDFEKLPEKRLRQAKFQRPGWRLFPTILTSRTAYYHPVEPRHLTAREAAAIQGFPPTYEFVGGQTSVWRQIGNAVCPPVAYAIGRAIADHN